MNDISDANGMNRRDDMGSRDCVNCMCGKGDRDSKDSRNRNNVSPDDRQVSAEPRISGQHAPTGSKLVFIDIDGTLADEHHHVPQSAIDACRQAQRNGHLLFICTGRSLMKIEQGILDLGFDGVVSVAGARADINGRTLFEHPISPEAIDAATAYFLAPDIRNYQWQGPDGMYVSRGYMQYLQAKGSAWKDPQFASRWHVIEDLDTHGQSLGASIRASKGSYFADRGNPTPFEDTCKALSPWFTAVSGTYGKISDNHGELLIPGVDKGTAVSQVARTLGYSISDTIALGDGGNDMAMILAAGTSVAMGNGIEEIKQAADMVTDSVEDDGFAHAFNRLGLI